MKRKVEGAIVLVVLLIGVIILASVLFEWFDHVNAMSRAPISK